ncbi:MAG: hypothetical protein U0Q07_06840 [Acidimicrobiales bacterium]
MRRRALPALAAPALALALAGAACGTKDDAPGGNGGPPLAQDVPAPSTTGTLRTATTVASPCPDQTALTVRTRSGDRPLTPTKAYADVTFDESASITFASYDLPQADAEKVFQPTLTGDQLAVNVYVSSTGGTTLTPGDYVPSKGTAGGGTVPQRQLNSYSVWSSYGREIASGFDLVEPVVRITSIDAVQVCGEITTPEVRGRFVAPRI